MKIKEKQRLLVAIPGSESRGQPVEMASGCWYGSFFRCQTKDSSENITDLWFSDWVFGEGSRVPVDFLSSPPSNRHEGCPHINRCDSSETYIKSSSFRLQGFGKRAALFSVMPYWEGGRIVGNLNLENCSQILAHKGVLQFSIEAQNFSLQPSPFSSKITKVRLFLFTK